MNEYQKYENDIAFQIFIIGSTTTTTTGGSTTTTTDTATISDTATVSDAAKRLLRRILFLQKER